MIALIPWNQIGVVLPVCVAALVLLIAPVVCIIKLGKTLNKKLWIAGYLLLLLWAARFLVGYFSAVILTPGEESLSPAEEFVNSLIHALQTFSMDEDYTEYTLLGKSLLEAVGLSRWAPVYGGVISVLNICAPILGGAMLLDILTNAFPRFRLALAPWRPKLVFSELNEAAVCLAEDICAQKNYRSILQLKRLDGRPVIVFTDAYLMKGSEDSSELFDRAHALGAICLRQDLRHIAFRRASSVHYFLMDTDCDGNISTLSHLLQGDRAGRLLWPGKRGEELRTRIYIFVENDSDGNLANKVCAERSDHADQVLVRIIQDYRNAAFNLMYDVPLFLPLLSKQEGKKRDLTVTILGGGQIAENVFKAAFWCGQIYGVQLHMNVVSYHVDRLEKALRQSCPELMESCRAESPILNVYPLAEGRQYNAPYSTPPQFIERQDVSCLPDLPEDIFRTTDYYIVALGADQRNLLVADQLRCQLMQQMLEQGDMGWHPVIAAAVFSKALGRAAEELHPKTCCPYVVTFADMRSRYTCKNVFMNDFTDDALSSDALYGKKQEEEERDDAYTYLSSLARTIHAPYKMFGLDAVEQVTLRDDGERTTYQFKSIPPLTEGQLDELAWIEHRRWVAFIRSQGFSRPTMAQLDSYAYRDGNRHKNLAAKLHPCLVETCLTPVPLPAEPNLSDDRYDGLDFASMRCCVLNRQRCSLDQQEYRVFKEKDYPFYDERLKRRLPKPEEALRRSPAALMEGVSAEAQPTAVS